MAFDEPTIVAANDAGNDTDYSAWLKARALIRAANAGQLQGFKNKIINGAAQIWQRGTSFSNCTHGQYTADRIYAFVGGATATVNVSQIDISADGLTQYGVRSGRSAGTEEFGLGSTLQRSTLEELKGKKVRFSVYLRRGSALGGTVTLYAALGTAETTMPAWGTSAAAGVAASALSSSAFSRHSVDLTIPAAATELCIQLLVHCSSQAGGANVHIDTALWQLEVVDTNDPVTTPFEHRPIGVELALCQRYYEKSFPLTTAPAQNVGANTGETVFPALQGGATGQRTEVQFKVRKRGAPTVTLYNPAAANAQARDETAGADCSSTTAANPSERGFNLTATGNASTAIANALGVHWAADAEI